MIERNMNELSEFDETKSWLENELLKRITVSPELTRVIFVGLTNRTNTGALATTIGRSPTEPRITRHIQPFKAIARQIMESKGVTSSTPLTFLKSTIELTPGINLIKETIGPNIENPAEWINSMDLLLSNGISPNQLTFIPTFRDLFDTIASWRFMWNWSLENFPYDSFNKSLEEVDNKIRFSIKSGIKVIPYVHEFLRDHKATKVIQRMCQLAEIPFNTSMVKWEETASNGQEDPYFAGSLIKYDQPPDRWIRGALSTSHGGRGELVWKPLKTGLKLTKDDQKFVLPKIQSSILIHKKLTTFARDSLGL